MSREIPSAPCKLQKLTMELDFGFESQETEDSAVAVWSGHGLTLELPVRLDDKKALMKCVIETARRSGRENFRAALSDMINRGR